MNATAYILMAIPVCILSIVMWIYYDCKKYKQQHYLIALLFLIYPIASNAQYTNGDYNISFKWSKNSEGKLEQVKDKMVYQFVPNTEAWEVIIRNTSDEEVQINWQNAEFIVNGKASGVKFHPSVTDGSPIEKIKSNSVISRAITASHLITEEKIKKIFDKKKFKKGAKMAITIVLPISMNNKPQFFHAFNFIVAKVD